MEHLSAHVHQGNSMHVRFEQVGLTQSSQTWENPSRPSKEWSGLLKCALFTVKLIQVKWWKGLDMWFKGIEQWTLLSFSEAKKSWNSQSIIQGGQWVVIINLLGWTLTILVQYPNKISHCQSQNFGYKETAICVICLFSQYIYQPPKRAKRAGALQSFTTPQ